MKAVGYIRVSTDEQIDGYSLSAQENAIRGFASSKGWQVTHIYIEAGKSAKDDNRPQFQQMIQDAQHGHFDVIVVHKLDRFSRNLVDCMTYLNQLDKWSVAFVSVTEQFDFSTPMGKVMLAMLGAFAQWYLDNLSSEVSKGKKERARKGSWNGTLSFGYTTPQRLRDRLNSKPSEDDAKLIESTLAQYPSAGDTDAIPCPFDSPAIVLAFDAYATGQHSQRSVADLLNTHGYRITSRRGSGLFSGDTVGNLLKSRFYLGETSYGVRVKDKQRKWMPGNHDAIVSYDTFDVVQGIMANRYAKYSPTPHNTKRVYPLTGLLIAVETGERWRGQVQRGKRRYLRTKTGSLSGRVVMAQTMEHRISQFLQGLNLLPSWQHHVKSIEQKQTPKYEADKLAFQLGRLKKLFLYGDISEDDYIRQSNQLKQQIKIIEDSQAIDVNKVIEVGQIIENIHDIWNMANLQEKKQLCRQLFEAIYLEDDQIVAIEPSAILWQLLQHGTRFGEDRERIRLGHTIILHPQTTVENLPYMLA